MVKKHDDQQVDAQPNDRDHGELNKLASCVTLSTFRERPEPIEREVLHYGYRETQRIGEKD